MKKGFIKYVVSLLMLTILSVQYSCVEEIPKTMENTVFTVKLATLTMSPNSIVFNTYEESSQTATVLSNDIDWEFADVPDWITISPMSGSANANNSSTVVTINCQTNNSLHDRMAVFTFRSKDSEWNYSTAITVSQVRHIYEAIPETDSINLPWTASQAVIRVDANNDEWSATAMEDLSSWCNVIKNSDGIVLSCTQNPSVQSRKGHVVIGTPDSLRTIVVVQSEIKVEVGVSDSIPESLQFSEKSGMSSLYINTHDDVHWTVTASDSWITLAPDNGTGSGTVNVSVTDNSDGPAREGTISVKAYDYIKEIRVYQNGKYLNVTSPSLSFGSKGGEIMLSIKSNDGWKASLSDASWMQLSEMTGNQDCDILLTVADNNSGYSRTGKVTITPNSAKPVVLNVEQAARYLAISDTGRIVFGHGGVAEKTIMVNTDGDYDVSTGCEYLDVVKEAGSFTISMNLKDPSSTVNDSVRVFLKNLSSGSMTISIPVVLYSVNRSAVDLGLSVMWATCNLGALQSWEFGDYYAWGETETKTKYSWTNYKYSNGGFRKLTKYCSDSTVGNDGFTDGKTELEPEDDVVHIEWGSRWHIPSINEINELIENCDWVWSTENEVQGYKITSKKTGYTDRSIFIPAGGYYSELYSDHNGLEGAYWSSTRDTREGDYYARSMIISRDSKSGSNHRSVGLSIRPVRSYLAQDFSKIELNSNQLELAIGYGSLLQVSATKKDGSSISFNDVKWTSSDTTVAVVSQGRVVAVGAGTCTVTATCGSLTDVCSVNVIDPDAVTREYVDLGLSVKWATFNVGSYRPSMYGDYYTWGETETYYENGYAQDTKPLWKQQYNPYGYNEWYSYKYSSDVSTSIKKYCTNPAYGYSGYSDNNVILDPDDDVAHVNWGDNWRMPTKEDFQELIDNCTMTWTVQDGVKGYLFTGKRAGYTDRSIFLPASGYRAHTSLQQLDSYGNYWTSSLYEDEPYSAGYFTFGSGSSNYNLSNGYRCYGLSVRPVYQLSPSELEEVWISPSNLQIVSGVSSVLEMRGVTKDDRSVYLRNVEWTSDNELVATVTNGKVKGLAAGTCTVTATYGGTLSASCEVTVIEVTKEMVVITDNIYVVANDYAYSTDYGDYMYGKHVSPRIAYDPDGNKCIVVSTRKGPENAYDEQLFIVSKGELRQGDALTLSFRVRGLYSQNSQTEAHYAPGKFLYMYPTSEVRVTNEWTQYSYEFTVGENVRTIAIDLSRLETGNDLFFDNISLISSNYGTAVFPDNIVSDGTERSHEYVDLGLSVNWATTNLGSESVDGVGGKYRWEDNSVDWGGEWRLPTKYEMEELKNNCTWFWTERNGVWGYLISSEIEGYKDRKLFLPAAHQDKDTAVGRYWTDSKESTRAWNMDFRMDSLSVAMKKNSISEELSIRPVLMSQSWVENLKVVGSAYNTVLVNGHCAVNVYVVVNGQVVDYPVTYTSDNNQIATVDENGVVTGISPGTTTITAECHGKTSTCTIKVVNEEHEFVDMGLSVKWATVNVGATEPEDYGYYFAWGEIDHEGPFDYTDYKWGTGTNSITKYNRMDGLKNLSASDDAASFVWGEDVHTPTEDEWIELIENCEWEWDRLNGINGYTVTAVNGNSIFLPAAGRMYKSDSSGDGSGGRYWSNSVSSSSYSSARGLYFSSSEHYVGSYGREYGFSVRPVCP